VRYLDHGQFRPVPEQSGQRAGVVRVEMLDEHERHPGVVREGIQQLPNASKPPAEAPIRQRYMNDVRRNGVAAVRHSGSLRPVSPAMSPWDLSRYRSGSLVSWGLIRLVHGAASSGRCDR